MYFLKLLYGFEMTLVVTIENNSFRVIFSHSRRKRMKGGRGSKTRGKVKRLIEWGGRRRGGRGERGTWGRKKRDGEREKDRREDEKRKINKK